VDDLKLIFACADRPPIPLPPSQCPKAASPPQELGHRYLHRQALPDETKHADVRRSNLNCLNTRTTESSGFPPSKFVNFRLQNATEQRRLILFPKTSTRPEHIYSSYKNR